MIYSKVFDGCLSIIEEGDQLIPMLVKCDRTGNKPKMYNYV